MVPNYNYLTFVITTMAVWVYLERRDGDIVVIDRGSFIAIQINTA